ncbi:hypothetical protein H5410_048536 [Solanum commersonii]|uniref:Uncharacterized protein n=1 Tax=Solanum commersonii TaxID=4109 RepID=A0A9J5XM05_SOLCO|nr:hypothetical protein H5410_048536 [Solanum commersonii]
MKLPLLISNDKYKSVDHRAIVKQNWSKNINSKLLQGHCHLPNSMDQLRSYYQKIILQSIAQRH